MAEYKNPMNIIEALVQLRNDLKLWVTNNLRVKMDKNLGVEESGKILSVDENGNIIPSNLPISTSTTLGGVKIGTGITIDSNGVISTVPIEVVDNLTSDATNKTLSANQGRILANADVGKKTNNSGAEIFNDYEKNRAISSYSHAEGQRTTAYLSQSHAEGQDSIAYGTSAHAEGQTTLAYGDNSHAEGIGHAFGIKLSSTQAYATEFTYTDAETTIEIGDVLIYNFAVAKIEGIRENILILSNTLDKEGMIFNGITVSHYTGGAFGDGSHAEGHRTKALGKHSHAEGNSTTASGPSSHAEGMNNFATGEAAHAEGDQSVSWGKAAHTEGILTLAVGEASHAGGNNCAAQGTAHFVHGFNLESNGNSQYPQTIFGQYNVKDEKENIIFMVGCGDSTTRKNVFEINSDGDVSGERVFGAVWNDYAEYRNFKDDFNIPYGRIVVENGDDSLSLSSRRMQKGGNICSDTFGFAIGKTEMNKMPIAVSGRVLAYPYEDKTYYEPGDAVCTGPNGTFSKMTREEIKEYPDCIIGYISAIPNYEYWDNGKIYVDGRIWIKVV